LRAATLPTNSIGGPIVVSHAITDFAVGPKPIPLLKTDLVGLLVVGLGISSDHTGQNQKLGRQTTGASTDAVIAAFIAIAAAMSFSCR
jgi:hypothetical protein